LAFAKSPSLSGELFRALLVILHQIGMMHAVLQLSSFRELIKANKQVLATLLLASCLFAICKHAPIPWLRLDQGRALETWELPITQRLFEIGWHSWIEVLGYAQLLIIVLPFLKSRLSNGGQWVGPFSRTVVATALIFSLYWALTVAYSLRNLDEIAVSTNDSAPIFSAVTMMAGAALLYVLGHVLNWRSPGWGFWLCLLLIHLSALPSEITSQSEYFSASNAEPSEILASGLLQMALLIAPVFLMCFRNSNCKDPFRPVLMIWIAGISASSLAFLFVSPLMEKMLPELWATFDYGPILSLVLRIAITIVVGWFTIMRSEIRAIAAITMAMMIGYMIFEDAVYANFEVKTGLFGLPALVIASLAALLSNKLCEDVQAAKVKSAFASKAG
jgi:hypothetical protein